MKPVRNEVEIDRPAPEVFAFLDDVTNNTRWLKGMRSCTWTTDPPVRAGSRYEQVAEFLGKEIRTSFEVTAHEPGRLVTIRSREGSSFPLTVTRLAEPIDDKRSRVIEPSSPTLAGSIGSPNRCCGPWSPATSPATTAA